MDAAMPGTGGLAATRTILASAPDATVLMLSMHSEETLVRQAMAAGARGYILKNAVDLDLAAAVKRAAAGETVLDPGVDPAGPAGRRTRASPDAARNRSPAADLRRTLQPGDRRATRPEREHRRRASRQHHERTRRAQDRRARRVRAAERPRQSAVRHTG